MLISKISNSYLGMQNTRWTPMEHHRRIRYRRSQLTFKSNKPEQKLKSMPTIIPSSVEVAVRNLLSLPRLSKGLHHECFTQSYPSS